MSKPNEKFTVKQMKDYIRTNSLNKKIKLTQKKADLVAGLKNEGHWEGSSPVKKASPKKAAPTLTKEQYLKLVKGSASLLTPALRKQMMDYQQKQIKGPKTNAYNKPFLIVNGREIWVDNKYIMKLGDQMENRDSKILGYFTKNDLWAKYNKYKYPEDPPEKKGLKFTHKDEGSLLIKRKLIKFVDV